MQTATRSIESTYARVVPDRIMSLKEALSHGVTLEEAERRLDELIYNHYHPQQQ